MKRPLSTFEIELSGLKQKEKKQLRYENVNILDSRLKQQRDEQTGSLSFVEDMNLLIDELGQRGFDYKRLNETVSNQIGEYALSTRDKRKLQLLNQIETPGGVYGNTVHGLRLKRRVANQIDANEEEDIRLQIAIENYNLGSRERGLKKEVGLLINQREATSDPQEKEEITNKINALLGQSRAEGMGDRIQTYYNNSVKGIETTSRTERRMVNLSDPFDPKLPNSPSIRQRITEEVLHDVTDTSVEAREANLKEWIINNRFALDDDGIKQILSINKSFKPYRDTDEFIDKKEDFRALINNRLRPYNVSLSRAERFIKGQDAKDIPRDLQKIIATGRANFRLAYEKAFNTYSNKLEGEEDPRYGYKQWGSLDKDNFFKSEGFNNVQKVLDKLDSDLDAYNLKNVPKLSEKKRHQQNVDQYMPGKSHGPRDYQSLVNMLWEDGGMTPTASITKQRFNDILVGIAEMEFKGQEYKRVHGIWSLSPTRVDVLKWWESTKGGLKSKKARKEQFKKLWQWGHYIIKHKQKRDISRNFTNMGESVIEAMKLIDKQKVKFPDKLSTILGIKAKIKQIKREKENIPEEEEIEFNDNMSYEEFQEYVKQEKKKLNLSELDKPVPVKE